MPSSSKCKVNLPATAVLAGYFLLVGFIIYPSLVVVSGTTWCEPVIVWLTVSMPTGSGKSTLFKQLYELLQQVQQRCGISDDAPAWVLNDCSSEKMGAMMNENACRLLDLYDDISAFPTKFVLWAVSDRHT